MNFRYISLILLLVFAIGVTGCSHNKKNEKESANTHNTDVNNSDVNNTDVNNTDVNNSDINNTDVNNTDVNNSDVNNTDVNNTDPNKRDVNDTDPNKRDVNDTDPNKRDVNDTDPNQRDVNDTDPNQRDVNDTDPNKSDVNDTDPNKRDVNDTDPSDNNLAPLPAHLVITDANLNFEIVSTYDDSYNPTVNIQGKIDMLKRLKGVVIKVPYSVTDSDVYLPAFSSTFTIASSSTQDMERGIVASFEWPAQMLLVGNGTFDAFITINDNAGNGDHIFNAKKLDIDDNTTGFVAASFKYALDSVGNQGTMKIKVIPGIPDRNFYVQTHGAYEHKFVYLPVVNPTTGRTWLNNNLGAEYADVSNPHGNYNKKQQATSMNDYLAYGSLFQWGREADGHELINWSSATTGTGKYGSTTTRANNPDDSLFIKNSSSPYDWRVTKDDTLWASESSLNNVCPVGYRLPLNPNGANDAVNEWYQETQTWSSKDASSAFNSVLKMSIPGYRNYSNSNFMKVGLEACYWTGSAIQTSAHSMDLYQHLIYPNEKSSRAYGFSVRCIKDQTPAEKTEHLLLVIGREHSSHKSTITVSQLKTIAPALNNIKEANEKWYQSYIEGSDSNISSPATREEIQSMIDEVNSFNLSDNAILDRNFYKKTNGKFEHRFAYLPVTNDATGRTWLNNNLGAEYSNVNSSNYKLSQQATASDDYLAYGSLFQWGRKADGHELINWSSATTGMPEYNATSIQADNPSNSLFIIGRGTNDYDWRVTRDDTLWASESSQNNVCPVGYRLPLNPNIASDGENEWYQETQTWRTKGPLGAYRSVLKLPVSGHRNREDNGNIIRMRIIAGYWTGSAIKIPAYSIFFNRNYNVNLNKNASKEYGLNVRCIKDQTPAEKTASILLEIGNEHSRGKSTITIAQLKAITPALDNIDKANEKWYQNYIEGSDTKLNRPARREEVQSIIDDVNSFNLPDNAILDRNFYKKTNGKFEHRFAYLPVINGTTGRTWLNNNLGAEYSNVDSNNYELSQQATASNDYKAYGSLFQWGRKADGYELINWISGTNGYGRYSAIVNNPSYSIFTIMQNDPFDWRTKRHEWGIEGNVTLWASESSSNNVCPEGYRLPLNPNGTNDGENEFYQEILTWRSKDQTGALNSVLKMPNSGYRDHYAAITMSIGIDARYWTGVADRSNAQSMEFDQDTLYLNKLRPTADGYSVRCIKDQTPAERSASILLEISNEHNSGKSVITIAQLEAITPALENIDDDNENIYQFCIANSPTIFSSSVTRDDVQNMINFVNTSMSNSSATLRSIGMQHRDGSSDITASQLKAISILNNIQDDNEKWYQSYIEGSDTKISSPATIKELQSMIDEVNGFNLPANAILDRKFYKKTNEEFEHRFVYLPVKNTTTGKTWLNNNLGAEYANINNPRNNYNPSQQAKTSNDYLAYGSLFQWGRAADGHELITWFENKRGRTKYALTERRADHPRTPAFIIVSDYPNDWRENTRDELWPLYSFWESESSQNNVCPVGYRLPLNPNYANDSANEFYQEIQTWTQENGVGALNSVLKLSLAGNRQGSTGWLDKSSTYGFYWTGSRYDFYALDMFLTPANVFPNYHDDRANGFSVRCIKD